MNNPGTYSPSAKLSKGGDLRQRASNFGITMMVMGGSFFLYYLGLFGGQEGPLNPEHIGSTLGDLGVTKNHIILIFLSIAIIAGIWDRIFNLINLLAGTKKTCSKPLTGGNSVCGATVKRGKVVNDKTGEKQICYVCPHGHKRTEAQFHPIRKGVFSHSLCITCLLFAAMIFFIAH